MNDQLHDIAETFLVVDDGLPLRIGGLVLAVLVIWRTLCLARFQAPPLRPPVVITPPVMPVTPPPRRWFRSRRERLEDAVELVQAETDLLLKKVAATQASAGLMRARADLQRLISELEPRPAPQRQRRAAPALSQNDIEHLIGLADLADDDRRRLLVLVASRFEEAS
jgi:hypothetical protein